MADLIHELIHIQADRDGEQCALLFKNENLSYSSLRNTLNKVAHGLLATGLQPGDRVAIYLPKQPETVAALFGTAQAGACFVPLNPLLKPAQVQHIVQDCQARILITSAQRLTMLAAELSECRSIHTIVVIGDTDTAAATMAGVRCVAWQDLLRAAPRRPHRRIDGDMAAILYTSGSTGRPKGVVVSHRNLVTGARSVAQYLENHRSDRILALLPLSFDAGLSQLTTAFVSGASAVLMDYVLPKDVLRAIERYQVTGLAAVPPIWNQLIRHEWPASTAGLLRYITNTGGAMPVATTRALRQHLPDTRIYLMYGLTEAFRSCYLPPEEVDSRPTSIGMAVPNAEILVVNAAGELCGPNEPGELVHRGPLVTLGYWNDRERTAERFRPCPGQDPHLPLPEMAVWSGDQVVRDENGYLYFIGRKDDQIKTSGYRVSPTEIEETAHSTGLIADAVAFGVPDDLLGQKIVLIITPGNEQTNHATLQSDVLAHCQRELPAFMVPAEVVVRGSLPHNPNGKIDRRAVVDGFLVH